MVSLPPHTSNHLQPLDLTFFSPLKNALYREYELYLTSSGHQKITEYVIAELLNRAFIKVATMEKAISGFQSAGIIPLNPEMFTEHDFAPSNKARQITANEIPEQESATEDAQHVLPNENSVPQDQPGTSGQHSDQVPSSSTVIQHSTSAENSFFSFAPIKKNKVSRKDRKTGQKQHSEILTSTPVIRGCPGKEKNKGKKNGS